MRPGAPDVEPWRSGVLQQVEDLGRWFSGRFVIDPDPSDELVPARSMLDRDALTEAITRKTSPTLSTTLPGVPDVLEPADNAAELDLRVAVSRFIRHYTASLTAVALVGLSRGIGLDLSPDRCTMVVRHGLLWSLVLDVPDGEVLRCHERPAPWPVSGPSVGTLTELREHVWRKLYAEHLWPVLGLAIEVGKISPGVVWSNAAEWPGLVRESAEEYLGPDEAAPFVGEAVALLEAPVLPDVPAETNPLADRFDWLDGDGEGFPEVVQTRKLCCLTYLLADRFGRLCQTCPYLPLPERIALVRERHGVPMGTPGGAAEQRAIERGLDRPSTRRMMGAKSKQS
jgi:hypothetical protein